MSVHSDMLLMVDALEGDEMATVCLDEPFATVIETGGSAAIEAREVKSTNSPAHILDLSLGETVAPRGREACWKAGGVLGRGCWLD